jgi:hypothetical protein
LLVRNNEYQHTTRGSGDRQVLSTGLRRGDVIPMARTQAKARP